MMILKQSFFKLFFITCLLPSCAEVKLSLLQEFQNKDNSHSRGLDVKGDQALIAGTKGYALHFKNVELVKEFRLSNAEDIRDVEILNTKTVLFMNSGDKGVIWRYDLAEGQLEVVFDRAGIFLDGLSFWDDQHGIAYGDPINQKLFLIETHDAGRTWGVMQPNHMPVALDKEAGFAASGTGIATVGDSTVYVVTGMADTARLFKSTDRGNNWKVLNTPLKAGESYGAYSMYFWSKKEGMIAGGSYLYPNDAERNCFYTDDGGDSWQIANNGLGGYISCVHGSSDGEFIVATGRVGTFYTLDRGQHWKKLMDRNFYSIKVKEDQVWCSGKDGEIAVFLYSLRPKY